MIPKIIHYCWFGGKTIPTEVKKYIDGWKKYNPDYELRLWNESNFNMDANQYVKEASEQKKWAFVSDYVRLKALYEDGGIYLDTDVEVVKSLDEFLNNPAFIGFEANDRINTGTIGAEKHNLWIKNLLDTYRGRRFLLDNGKLDLTTNVVMITNIMATEYSLRLDNSLQRYEDVTVYPFDYFCAKDIITTEILPTERTVTIHHFKGTWTNPKDKLIKCLIGCLSYDKVRSLVNIKRRVQGKKEI